MSVSSSGVAEASRDGLAAIVLAAGASRRMGRARNKLLESVAGRPMIAWPVAAFLDAGIERVTVALGHEADAVREALASFGDTLDFVTCPDWREGMGRTIASAVAGGAVLGSDRAALTWEGLFLSVGDLPGLRAEVVLRLIEARAREARSAASLDDGIWVPTAAGRRGHPVLFGAAHADRLVALQGDVGARELIRAAGARVRAVEVGTDAILHDVDTPEDLDRIRG